VRNQSHNLNLELNQSQKHINKTQLVQLVLANLLIKTLSLYVIKVSLLLLSQFLFTLQMGKYVKATVKAAYPQRTPTFSLIK